MTPVLAFLLRHHFPVVLGSTSCGLAEVWDFDKSAGSGLHALIHCILRTQEVVRQKCEMQVRKSGVLRFSDQPWLLGMSPFERSAHLEPKPTNVSKLVFDP